MRYLKTYEIRDICHDSFFGYYEFYTFIVIFFRVLIFKRSHYHLLYDNLMNFGIIYMCLMILPFIFCLLPSISFIFEAILVIGPSTLFYLTFKIKLEFKLLLLTILVLSTISLNSKVYKNYLSTKPLIPLIVQNVYRNLKEVLIVYSLAMFIFTAYILGFVFTITEEIFEEPLMNRFMFFSGLFDLIHLNWTSYLIIYNATHLLGTYIGNISILQTEGMDFKCFHASLRYLDSHAGKIAAYMIMANKDPLSWVFAFFKRIFILICELLALVNIHPFFNDSRHSFGIQIMILTNKCACRYSQNLTRFRNFDEKFQGIYFYFLRLRYFLTFVMLYFIFKIQFKPYVYRNYFELGKIIFFAVFMVILSNVLMFHFVISTWKTMYISIQSFEESTFYLNPIMNKDFKKELIKIEDLSGEKI